MNASHLSAERDRITERMKFIDAIMASAKPAPKPEPPYGCQQSDITRLCRYDRRALDRKCDGCPRVTDREYLESQGLWIEGISHE